MMTFTRRLHGDENGSMVLALMAVIVAGGLMTALVAATVASQRETRFDTSFNQAVHAAELGLQQALFLLDEDRINAGTAPVDAPMTTPVVNGKTATWVAVENPPNSGNWLITSEGTDNGVTRRVQVRAERGRRFPAAIYTEVKLHLTGERTISSYSGSTLNTGNGDLHSGGTLDPAATINDGTLDNTPLKLANPENMRFITDTLDDCAAAGPLQVWRSSTAATPGLLNLTGAGPHCFSELRFDRDTVVVGTPDSPAVVYVQGLMTFSNKAIVKVAPSCGDPNTCAEAVPRTASAFQVYSAGTSVLFGKNHVITGAYYAPAADCEGNLTMPNTIVYGALVCNSLKTNGNFELHYDDAISNIKKGAYNKIRWTECRPLAATETETGDCR